METESFLDELKQELDRELPPENTKELIHLVNDKFDYNLNHDDILASTVVTLLENNMTRSKVISVLKHALAVMKFHARFGTRYLAGWIESYKKSHDQLDDENFVGRREDIEKLCDILNTTGYLGVWIYGFGGLGKTTIAKEIGSRMIRVRGIKFLIVDLKQADTTSDMYRSILRQLNQFCHETDRLVLQIRARTVILQGTQNETWILLDNIEDIYSQNKEEIGAFLNSLNREANYCKVKFLVTSRIVLDGYDDTMYKYKLGPLDDDACLRFLRSSCRPAVLQDSQYRRAAEYCGNIPLALVLYSNTVSQQAAKGILVSNFNLINITNGLEQIQECIRYAFERLTDILKTRLILLSTFGRSRFNAASVCKVLDMHQDEALCTLMQLSHYDMVQKAETKTENVAFLLVEAELAENNENDEFLCYTYFFHELLLRFLQQQTDACPCEEFSRCEERFTELILRGLGRCFADYFSNSRTSIQHISDNAHLLRKFFSTLSPKVLNTVSLTECEHLQMVATHVMATDVEKRKVLTQIHDISEKLECRHFWKIQDVAYCIEHGSWDEAVAIITKLENDPLAQGLPAQSQRVLKANLLYQKGRLSRKKKAYLDAKNHLRLALEIFQQDGSNDPETVRTHANVLNSLGNVAYDLKEYDRSLEYHKQALEVMRRIVGDSVHHEMSMFKFNIGTIALAKARQIKQVCGNAPLSGDDGNRIRELMTLCLEKMDESIEEDVKLGLHGLSDFAEKLQNRSDARLDVKDFAGSMADAEECLRIREKNLKENNAKRLLTNHRIGKIYLKQRQHATSTDEKRALLMKARDKFNIVVGNILDGYLTKDSEGIRWFLFDLERVADATLDKSYKAKVNSLCRRVRAGESIESSDSSSSTVDDPDTSTTSGDSDTNERKDSGVLMEDVTGDTEISDTSKPEIGGVTVTQAPFQRMFSDEVFYSGDDEFDLSDLDQALVQKRKRESDSD